MQAIKLKQFGGVENMEIGTVDMPTCGPEDLLVKIKATALNRADLLQRRGKYNPPPGETDIMGSGVVEQVGSQVPNTYKWKQGDAVMALLPGGGYAEYAVIPASMAMAVPTGMSWTDAAAIPETYLTSFLALHWLGEIQSGQDVLIHGGASGIGVSAIQLAKMNGNKVVVTVGSEEKAQACLALGADHAINYKDGDWSAKAVALTREQKGFDFLLDFVGANYWNANLKSMREDGRMVMLGFLSGTKVTDADLAPILTKRIRIIGSQLRTRSKQFKGDLTQDFIQKKLPLFDTKQLKPVVDTVFDWTEIQAAHLLMEKNQNVGKIVVSGM